MDLLNVKCFQNDKDGRLQNQNSLKHMGNSKIKKDKIFF